jgi:plasmid maintenance system killer protein
MIRIRGVEALDPFRVRLEFTDGSKREVDLEIYLRGPVFEPIRNDPEVFRSIRVDPQLGTIVWPNGADVDPDVLYHELKPAWMEEETAKHQ